MRDNIILKCTECPERVEFKKYCPRCNKKTVHKEKK